MKSVVFFNNKGGVGKTSLVYHLAWMFADLGTNVLAVDLDPQANLSAMFLDEERLEELWPDDGRHPATIQGVVAPILRGRGDIAPPHVENLSERLGLLVGDLGLARFEARLSAAWPGCLDRDEAAFRVVSSFYRAIELAGESRGADLALIDVGPNLGAINRSALLAADCVVVPLAADLFSLQGLRNLGPNLRDWRNEWADRLSRRPEDPELRLPRGQMLPIGYIVQQHAVRMDRPVKAFDRWMARIPAVYSGDVLGIPSTSPVSVANDDNCLAMLKNYRSLMPLAQDALKPMFYLKAADGALGGHLKAVQDCYIDFKVLARRIAARLPSDDLSLTLGFTAPR
ncbi:MAG: AAA family ATPase [Planctomycetota bacterium]|nr:AAA family ATPase [Planctomycetota bacterium]